MILFGLFSHKAYCALVLDTIDQSVNKVHDFAGHVFTLGEIIVCAPRESKAQLEEKKEM